MVQLPFYFGIIRGLTFLLAADRCRSLHLFMITVRWWTSPILNDANAAWDLIWAVPPLAIDRSQTISTRLVYQRPEAPSHDYTDAAWLEEGHF